MRLCIILSLKNVINYQLIISVILLMYTKQPGGEKLQSLLNNNQCLYLPLSLEIYLSLQTA